MAAEASAESQGSMDQSSQLPKDGNAKNEDTQSSKKSTAASVGADLPTSVPSALVTRPVRANPDRQSIENFFSELNDRGRAKGSWRVNLSETGEVFRVLGGEVLGATESVESVRQFMAEAGPEFGVPSEQVTERIEHDSTGQFDLYDSVQTVNGTEVFEGYFRVIGNKTHNGFMFNNGLKPVNLEQVVLPAPISIDEAEQILRSLYAENFKKIRERTGPVIWASEAPHQTAYVFDITVTDNDYKVVIGAQTRTRIMERTTRMH